MVDGVRIDAVAGVVDFATGPVAKDWAALDKAIDALERDALLKRGVLGEFVEAGRWVGDPTTPMGRPATSLMRREPGVATGGKSLKDSTGTLFPQAQGRPGVDPRIAAFPRQIARRMRGMHFKNFDDFRETFWKMVANDPALGKGWRADNLARMRDGRPPRAPSSEAIGGGSNAVYLPLRLRVRSR